MLRVIFGVGVLLECTLANCSLMKNVKYSLTNHKKRDTAMSKFKSSIPIINEREKLRFESKITKTDSCWIWGGGIKSKGYGYLYIKRSSFTAHRVSYSLYVGNCDNLLVLHKCDNPPCVNPDHLFLGTDLDNATDRMNKGRFRSLHGEENGSSKLTELQVREILTSSERNKD